MTSRTTSRIRIPLLALLAVLFAVCGLAALPAPARAQTETASIDTLQHTAFCYFWNEANPANG